MAISPRSLESRRGLASAIGTGAILPPIAGLIDIVVTSTTTLALALIGPAGLLGGTIRLAGATPYSIALDNVAPLSTLRITSFDPANPSTIDIIAKAGSGGGALTNWKRVRIDGVKFDRTAISYASKGQFVPNVWLDSPDGVEIVNSTFKGRATARWPGDTNPGGILKGDMGLRLVSPKNCRVEGNTTDGYGFWIQATGDGQNGNSYRNNSVRRSQFDGMQFVGGGDGLTITGNDISDTLGSINDDTTDSGNHDDLIQIATTGSATGWDNVAIQRNILDGGGKDTPQGIFIKDEGLKGIRNLDISNNAVRNSQGNGIGVNGNSGPGITLTVANNLVLWSAVPHDPADAQITNAKPAINLQGGCTGTSSNNLAGGFTTTGSTITQTGNVTLTYTDTASANYPGNLLPGSMATGVDKYRLREAVLPAGSVPGPDILKRPLSLLPNRLFGLSSGQSNQEYFYTNSRFEFEAAMNDLSPSAISYVFGNGATEGSALLEVNKPARDTYWWWNDVTSTPGPRYDKWAAAVDTAIASGRAVNFTIWNQGEGDAFFIGASDAQAARYFNARAALFALMRAKVPGLRIFLAPMNRRDVDYSSLTANYIAGIEKIRDFDPVYAAANPSFCTLLPEMYDQPGDGGAHSTDPGYDTLAIRFARKIGKAAGYTVAGGVDGPRLVAAVRSGTSVVFEFAHDGGTGLTPATGGEGLRYTANGTVIALSNVTVTDATHVSATLASEPAVNATEVAEFGYGTLGTIDWTKVVRDNQTVPLPVRHGKVTPTVASQSPGMSSVWTNTLFNRNATTANGQTLPNQITAPADGSAQTAYDAMLGSSTSGSTDDPLLVAASGGVPAYFRNDGNDSIQTVATDFLKRLSTDRAWSYGLLLKAPSVWTAGTVPVLFGAGAAAASAPGIQARYVVNNNQIRIATADGSSGPSVNLTATLPTTGYILVVMAYDPSTKTLTFYINSATSLTIPSTTALNGAAGTANFISGSALPDGAGWIEDVMATGIKGGSDVTALRDYWQTKYGISLF